MLTQQKPGSGASSAARPGRPRPAKTLSTFARVVDNFCRRAQTQERLTRQIAEQLQDQLSPRGIGVVVEAEHTFMSLLGVRAVGSRTVTSALFGALRENPSSRSEFLSLTRNRRGA